jgi:hypothetical protein
MNLNLDLKGQDWFLLKCANLVYKNFSTDFSKNFSTGKFFDPNRSVLEKKIWSLWWWLDAYLYLLLLQLMWCNLELSKSYLHGLLVESLGIK